MAGHSILALALVSPFLLTAQERIADHNFHGWFYLLRRPSDRRVEVGNTSGSPGSAARRGDEVAATAASAGSQLPGEQGSYAHCGICLRAVEYLQRICSSCAGQPGASLLAAGLDPVSHRPDELEHAPAIREPVPGRSGPAVRRTKYRFENRFRAWQQIKIPLAPKKYFTAYDEFWVYVKPFQSNSVFDQNRAYVALGFDLKPTLRLEVGYMIQTFLVRSGSRLEYNHTIVVSLFSNARLFGSNNPVHHYVVPRCTEPGYESPRSSVIRIVCPRRCGGEY